MARKSRTALLERYARAERPVRPSDARDWVSLDNIDLTPAAPVYDARTAVQVTRAMAGALR